MEAPRTFRISRIAGVKVDGGVGCRITFMGGSVDVPRSAADAIERGGKTDEVHVVRVEHRTQKAAKVSALAYWGGTTGVIPEAVADEIEDRLK